MPCHSYSEDEERTAWSTENAKLREEIDEVTRLLCSMLRSMNAAEMQAWHLQVPGLQQWWKTHEIADFKRQQAEEKQRLDELKQIEKLRDEADRLEAKLLNKKK